MLLLGGGDCDGGGGLNRLDGYFLGVFGACCYVLSGLVPR